MTRINAGVHPSELCRQHLLSEHREIKRIPNAVRSGRAKLTDIPAEFCLGKGHVRFFYNKLEYLRRRYAEIRQECLLRGYNVEDYSGAWDGIPDATRGDYEPSDADRRMVLDRIQQRLNEMGE